MTHDSMTLVMVAYLWYMNNLYSGEGLCPSPDPTPAGPG